MSTIGKRLAYIYLAVTAGISVVGIAVVAF